MRHVRRSLGGRRRPLLILSIVAISRVASAQTADDLAKQTQNPVSSLISVPFQANWDVGIGSREAAGTTLNVQPVAPFSLVERWNIILRVIMPLVSQPADDGLRINGMSDTVATAFLSPAKPGRVIWGAGPVLLLPTATDNALGSEQVGAGPSGSSSRSRTTTLARGWPSAPASKPPRSGTPTMSGTPR